MNRGNWSHCLSVSSPFLQNVKKSKALKKFKAKNIQHATWKRCGKQPLWDMWDIILCESPFCNKCISNNTWGNRFPTRLPYRKLTWHWNIPIFNRKYIFKLWNFHCHVSFWRGIVSKHVNSMAKCNWSQFVSWLKCLWSSPKNPRHVFPRHAIFTHTMFFAPEIFVTKIQC